MVVIDSSESSSDEEDRRLKPIRNRNGIEWASETRVFDALEKPEGSAVSQFMYLEDDQNDDSFPILYPKTHSTTLTSCSHSENGMSFEPIDQDITQELISHTRSLESFVEKIEQIPSQSIASQKLRVGLKLINEFLCTMNSYSTSDNVHSNEIFKNSDSLHDDSDDIDGPEDWHNCIVGKDYYSFKSDVLMNTHGKSDLQDRVDAGSQTSISGEVIPRDATAALEFFQELIKNV